MLTSTRRGVQSLVKLRQPARFMSFKERLPQRTKFSPQRTQQHVRIYLKDQDATPLIKFEAGIHINQLRSFLNVKGGGLKVKGDSEDIILKDRYEGFEGGDYVFMGFASVIIPPLNPDATTTNTNLSNSSPLQSYSPQPTPAIHPQPTPTEITQMPQMQHIQQMQQMQQIPQMPQMPQMIPQVSMDPSLQHPAMPSYPPPNYLYSPQNFPQNLYPIPQPTSSPTPQQINNLYTQQFPPKSTHTTNKSLNTRNKTPLSEEQASLASELGIDKEELEMFPWLVTDTTKPW